MEFLIGAQVESRGRDYRTSIGGGNWFKIAWHGQCQGGLREDLWMYKPSPQNMFMLLRNTILGPRAVAKHMVGRQLHANRDGFFQNRDPWCISFDSNDMAYG
ncbi:hypothetical protein IFM89_015644 [Coptis chinensis]|uniref:Uncharacterized protein n=1 Tax=Coptis chinensis TaxID=261450 RepID=A0A835MF88_9MAGN|nr:hypothetical protein IFM89_015644 [Coptis chinensis]